MRLDSVRELKAQLSSPGARARAAPAVALGVHPAPGGGFRLAVRVQDAALIGTDPLREIEAAARGEVDVRVVGRIVKRDAPFFRARRRPLLIGASVGHVRVTAGTIGAFARVAGDDRPRLLSNNHVLADENRGAEGDAVLQPGTADGGADPADRIGALASFIALDDGGANAVDAALAAVDDGIDVDAATLTDVGTLAGPVAVEEEIAVGKLGRTTGRTAGRVTAFEVDNVLVGYDAFPSLRFDDQLEIASDGGAGPFSQGGDSGSLIFAAGDRHAVGLLFAGGEEGGVDVTYANPITTVLDRLRATLLT